MNYLLMRIGNVLTATVLRSPLHWIMSRTSLLLALTGRKSGHPFTLPVNYCQDGDVLYITSLRSRMWWRNLRGGAPVILRLEGRDVNGDGTLIENSTDMVENLKQFFRIRPQAARFFGIRLDIANNPNRKDIFWLAQERVLIKVRLNQRIPTPLLRG